MEMKEDINDRSQQDAEHDESVVSAAESDDVRSEAVSESKANSVETSTEYEPAEAIEGVSVKILTDMQREVEHLKREVKEKDEQVLRVQAEMQNLRRRVDRDVENAHKYALEKFVQDLLPVVDSLDRGVESVPEDDENQKAAREGLVLTQKLILDTLAKFNIEVVDPTGSAFDPQYHEAITMVSQSDVEPNTVLNTVQKGYKLNGRLVRPAMVVVSQGAA